MSENRALFDRRLRWLSRRREAMSNGYETVLRRDGLIIVRPQRTRIHLPLKFLFFAMAALILFKAVLLSHLGAESYGERVGMLQVGTPVERAGAFVMQLDPATEFIAARIGPMMR